MTQVQPTSNESIKSESGVSRPQPLAQRPMDRILQKLSRMELPAQEHFERYMRHKWRLNHKRSTLQGSFTSIRLFLEFYGKSGKRTLEEMERADLEAFIEHVQDRGLRISTVRTRLACLICFFAFPDGTGSHLRGPPEKTHSPQDQNIRSSVIWHIFCSSFPRVKYLTIAKPN